MEEPDEKFLLPVPSGQSPVAAMYGQEPPEWEDDPDPPSRRRIGLPILLFLATCFTTYQAYFLISRSVLGALAFSACIMLILTMHELGHFFQALRCRVPASLPFFIPMPIGPFGTMGAVIGMQAHVGDRRAIFDIGVTGPIAGLVPTLICCVVGLHLSEVIPGRGSLGEPLLLKWLVLMTFGPLEEGTDVFLHPIAYAGWVGLFITSLNLIPIGQLDGGHVLYCLLGKKAHLVSSFLLAAAVGVAVLSWMGIVAPEYKGWVLMLALLILIGPRHPPTADDTVPLGTGRVVLGWLSLCFVIIGFTPTPFM